MLSRLRHEGLGGLGVDRDLTRFLKTADTLNYCILGGFNVLEADRPEKLNLLTKALGGPLG